MICFILRSSSILNSKNNIITMLLYYPDHTNVKGIGLHVTNIKDSLLSAFVYMTAPFMANIG